MILHIRSTLCSTICLCEIKLLFNFRLNHFQFIRFSNKSSSAPAVRWQYSTTKWQSLLGLYLLSAALWLYIMLKWFLPYNVEQPLLEQGECIDSTSGLSGSLSTQGYTSSRSRNRNIRYKNRNIRSRNRNSRSRSRNSRSRSRNSRSISRNSRSRNRNSRSRSRTSRSRNRNSRTRNRNRSRNRNSRNRNRNSRSRNRNS